MAEPPLPTHYVDSVVCNAFLGRVNATLGTTLVGFVQHVSMSELRAHMRPYVVTSTEDTSTAAGILKRYIPNGKVTREQLRDVHAAIAAMVYWQQDWHVVQSVRGYREHTQLMLSNVYRNWYDLVQGAGTELWLVVRPSRGAWINITAVLLVLLLAVTYHTLRPAHVAVNLST